MAFLLRNISHSADGREIVRTSRIDDTLLKIGRDPDCDVLLNDLAVALHHATIEQVAATRVGVSAEMGMTVEIDGQTRQDGQIDLSTGGTVKIGPFLLRVLAQEIGSEDVAIDVQRADAGGGDDRFDSRRFALQTVMPSKRTTAWTLVGIVLILFLVWPIWSFYISRNEALRYAQGYHADQAWLSGSLSQGHASLGENCQACHVEPFVPVRDAACTACHTSIHDHAPLARMQRANPNLAGFGRIQQAVASFFGQEAGRCVDCHTEHEGPSRIPPTPQRFCADCHTDLRSRLPDAQLDSAADFGAVHPEFQPAVLIRWTGDRPALQRIPQSRRPVEASNLKFPHALHLDPRGGAAQMARRLAPRYGFGQQMVCADCHVPTPDGVRFQPPNMEADCAMCHSLAFDSLGGTIRTLRHGSPEQVIGDIRSLYRAGGPPRPPELDTFRFRPGDVMRARAASQFDRARTATPERGERAIRAVFSPGGACFDCHAIQQPPPGTLNYRIRPVAFPMRYMLHGWFDHRAHLIVQRPGQPRLDGSAACLSCHRAGASNNAGDLLLPDLASCRVCHGGERSRLPVPSTCAMCHDYHMDGGVPAQLLRQRVRGRRWESTVIPVHPAPAQRRR